MVANKSVTSVQEGLTRKFAMWSLAIFSSLSGSDAVMLDHSAVWAVEDPVESQASETKKEPQPRKSPIQARRELARMIQAQDFAKAAQFVDEAIARDPSVYNLNLSYTLAQSLKGEEAIARLGRLVDQLSARLDVDNSSLAIQTFVVSAQTLASHWERAEKRREAILCLESASQVIDKLKQSNNPMASGLISMRLGLLAKEGRTEEVKAIYDKKLEAAFEKARRDPTPANNRELAIAIGQFASTLRDGYADELAKIRDSAEKIFLASIEKEEATSADFSPYQTLLIGKAMDLSDADPDQAISILEGLQARAKEFSSSLDEAGKKQFKPLGVTLNTSVSSLKAKRLRRSLIGQKAPDFDIDALVNMDEVRWDTLKGKVVLIDFWAVWSGPCIENIPRLNRLVHQYADSGLEVIGVTRKYGYTWDFGAKRIIANKTGTLEDELVMLGEFRKHHELRHGFVVIPEGSDYMKKFGVVGPQTVLVDQNGVIQLIRVGSDEQNATEIENKIIELLEPK